MPAVNRAQQKALYAKKGSEWVHAHGFDKIKGQRKSKRSKRKSSRK